MVRPDPALPSFPLALAAALVALTIFAIAPVGSAEATEGFTRTLGQPCIACHTSGVSSDLNARGNAFSAMADHETDPATAWALAVEQVPLDPSSDGRGLSALVPLAVLALVAAWGYTMIRRRGKPT